MSTRIEQTMTMGKSPVKLEISSPYDNLRMVNALQDFLDNIPKMSVKELEEFNLKVSR